MHSTFVSPPHHFDASHWTGHHLGDVHHFGLFHDGRHHVFDHHHDFHHDFDHGHFGFVRAGFYGWSYPYYDYPYYYGPSYYEVPVYPSTNVLYQTKGGAVDYAAAQSSGSTAESVSVPDVFMPRTELPSRQAPEALPDEKAAQPPRDILPSESAQPNDSTK